jgi:hypothetical protein
LCLIVCQPVEAPPPHCLAIFPSTKVWQPNFFLINSCIHTRWIII